MLFKALANDEFSTKATVTRGIVAGYNTNKKRGSRLGKIGNHYIGYS